MTPGKRARLGRTGLFLAAISVLLTPALAQEPAPDASVPASVAPEEAAPASRPKKRPPVRRPAAKPPASKPVDASVDAPAGPSTASEGERQGDPASAEAPPTRKPTSRPPKPPAAKPAVAGKLPVAAAPAGQPQAPEPAPSLPAALSPLPIAAEPPSACEARAALYDGQKGFSAFVTRIGRVEVENPLRPLTPEVTRVLQLTIGGKVATAYGPDLSALRRGGSPAALESQLGGGIRWEPSLPLLPETLSIVSEAGEPLARLTFRACADAPAVKAPPPQANAKDRKPGARRQPGESATPKTPPGFQLPQGAIAQ